jgi:hypothetical protein
MRSSSEIKLKQRRESKVKLILSKKESELNTNLEQTSLVNELN